MEDVDEIQSAIDSSSAESRGLYIISHVFHTLRGFALHGGCHHFGQTLLEETRETLQVRSHRRRP